MVEITRRRSASDLNPGFLSWLAERATLSAIADEYFSISFSFSRAAVAASRLRRRASLQSTTSSNRRSRQPTKASCLEVDWTDSARTVGGSEVIEVLFGFHFAQWISAGMRAVHSPSPSSMPGIFREYFCGKLALYQGGSIQ